MSKCPSDVEGDIVVGGNDGWGAGAGKGWP